MVKVQCDLKTIADYDDTTRDITSSAHWVVEQNTITAFHKCCDYKEDGI